MRLLKAVLSVACAVGGAILAASHFGVLRAGDRLDTGALVLPNGWAIKPAGAAEALKGDLPLRMCLTPDGNKLVVATGGWHDQGLSVIDLRSRDKVEYVPLGDAWAGLAIDGDTAYVSGGPLPVRTVSLSGNARRGPDIDLDKNQEKKTARYTAGIAKAGSSLWVARTERDIVQRLDPATSAVTAEVHIGYRPYGVAASPHGSTIAVSNWGDQTVSLIRTSDCKEIARVKVGSHPNDLVFSSDGRLFVANSGSNSVSVIEGDTLKETIRTSLDPKALVGSTPDALAVTSDGKKLFVANADNNDVAVVDVSGAQSKVEGFIPTGWYPCSLAVSKDDRQLFVGTGKGMGFGSNYPAKTKFPRTEYSGKFKYDYIPSLLAGNVSVVDVPDAATLAAYTRDVARTVPTPPSGRRERDAKAGLSQIKHVVYVIRENRTYDQVFGDLPHSNGDPNLVLFGEQVTPNAHKLARDFVTLDNLYCNGEVSEDGHQWCDSAYATDFVERAWVNSYSGRGEPVADDRLTASPNGYMWDDCRLHGKSYYSYGEYSNFSSDPDSPPKFTGNHGLQGHGSLRWSQYQHGDDFGRDYQKIDVFLDDLKAAEKTGTWPDFVVMSLGEDHTNGLRSGKYTPQASVASNDLALSKMVEAITRSRFWKNTAIFVIEDDAQNGPDHVDAHRTAGLVISPYTRRGVVDSTMYSTASYVRTIEMILGLPPMTQFDEHATPLYGCFTSKPNFSPYDPVPETIDLQAKNPEQGALEAMSDKLDWSGYDRADPDKLNMILWRSIKGKEPMPAPARSAALALTELAAR